MYYVNVMPRYYVLNLTNIPLAVDGQGILRYRDRIVVNSELV